MCTCFEILQSPALQGTITVSPQIHIEPLLGYLQSVSNLHVLRQLHRCLRFIFTVAPFQIRTSTDKVTATTRTATLLSQNHIQIRKLTNKNSTTISTTKTLLSQITFQGGSISYWEHERLKRLDFCHQKFDHIEQNNVIHIESNQKLLKVLMKLDSSTISIFNERGKVMIESKKNLRNCPPHKEDDDDDDVDQIQHRATKVLVLSYWLGGLRANTALITSLPLLHIHQSSAQHYRNLEDNSITFPPYLTRESTCNSCRIFLLAPQVLQQSKGLRGIRSSPVTQPSNFLLRSSSAHSNSVLTSPNNI